MSQHEPIAGPTSYRSLITTYALLTLYGVGSSIVGVATLIVVSGQAWGLLWPFLVALFSLGALLATLRSRATSKRGVELVVTLLLIALLAGYTIAIIVRTFMDGHMERLPIGLLPIIISVNPFSRLLFIARTSQRRR